MDAPSPDTGRWVPRGILLPVVLVALIVAAQVGFGFGTASGSQGPDAAGQSIMIDCDRGQSIGQALTASRPGATITVRGTCQEAVTVTTDGLTLDGDGVAVLDGGNAGVALTIDGARGVTIRGFTVQNGSRGIDVLNVATLSLEDTLVRGNRSHGVEITNASVDADNVTSHGNGRAGLIVNRNSLLNVTDSTFEDNLTGLVLYSNANTRLTGTNRMIANATQGLTVGLGAVAFSLGSTIVTEDNGEEGTLLLQDGGLQLIGGRLEVAGNGLDGVRVDQVSSLTIGITEFGVSGEAIIAGNGGNGITVSDGSNLVVSEIMPVTSQANTGAGLFVDASDVSVDGSRFDNNDGAGIQLSFGTKATLEGNTVDTMTCDDTVLSRGTTTCPQPPAT